MATAVWPPTETWHLIGDFCDIDDWHPDVNACTLRVVDGALTRILTTVSGEQFIQKRIASKSGLSYTYTTVGSSLPIDRFTATLSMEHGEKSRIEWSANISSDDPAMEKFVVDDIEDGLSAIERLFRSR